MEPEAKKPKHKPTALHDAIANINHATFCQHIAGFCGEMEPGSISDYSTTKALLNIFDRNRDAAMIKDGNGYYPLYLVFRYRVPYWQDDFLIYKLVTRLLYHYPDAMLQQCWDGMVTNPAHFAALYNDPDLIEFVSKINISLLNKLDGCSRTPLQVACSSKCLKAVETILHFSDININNIDYKGLTALFCWTEWRIISKLLQYPGVDVTVKDKNGANAFFLFLSYVNRMQYKITKRSHVFKVVQMFMTCPGVLHLKNGNDQNILHLTVIWNNPHLLSLLLSYKNDLWINLDEQVDNRGETALHKACSFSGRDFLSWKNAYPECLDMLLSNIDDIATINLQNNNGDTALHKACNSANHVAVKELLKIPGIDLNIFNKCGDTPIFYAFYGEDEYDMEFKCLKCLRLLLNHNECLILARDRRGFRIPDLARNRLNRFSNGYICGITPHPRRNELMNDMIEFITELEAYMAKARWQIYQEIYKSSLVSYAKSSVSRT